MLKFANYVLGSDNLRKCLQIIQEICPLLRLEISPSLHLRVNESLICENLLEILGQRLQLLGEMGKYCLELGVLDTDLGLSHQLYEFIHPGYERGHNV